MQTILQQGSNGATTDAVPVVTNGLAEYDIEQAIGKGGYAVVYKGKRKKDGLVVAIKRVEIAEMAPKKRERCIKEVHLLQQLNHPHIIVMYDAFVDHNQLVIITEWAPGGDLKKLIRRMAEAGRRFEEAEIWHYFLQIVDGLRGMHAARILHRDIKPANVLVCAAGVLKLGDLGLGRKMGPQTVDVMSKVGTPYYCSPEVVKGVKYDFKSDMWSCGCLLYELAMLRSPFETEGANLYDVFSKISKGTYQPLPADRFSPALRSLVNSLLAQDPLGRPTAELVWQQGQVLLQQVQQQQQQQVQQQQGQPAQQQLQGQQGSFNRRQQDASSFGDVCLLSEHLVATLLVIASEAPAASSSNSSKLNKSPSKKARPGAHTATAAAAATAPQWLKQLHPLVFAQPLSAFGSCVGSGIRLPKLLQEEQAQLQMGLVVQVCAWLARLMGKLDAAQALEPELQLQRGTGSSSSSTSSSSLALPVCRDCLRAAEALRRAAQSAGLQGLEAAAAAELVVGHGRAVCWLLQAMADAAFAQRQLVLRRCSHTSSKEEAQCIEELQHTEADAAADIAASAAADAADSSQDLQDFELGSAAAGVHRKQPVSSSIDGAASSSQNQQPSVAGHRAVIKTQVDAFAWHAEAERLGPQLLARTHLPASSSHAAPGLDQEWMARWQATRSLQQQLVQLVGQVQSSLPAVHQGVAQDLQRLVQLEQRLNQQMAAPLGKYAEMRQHVDDVLQQRQDKEDTVQAAQQQLHRISNRLDDVQQHIAGRTDQLQGSVMLQRHRTAVTSLKDEIQQMELRLGLLQHQLVKYKRDHQAEQAQLQMRKKASI